MSDSLQTSKLALASLLFIPCMAHAAGWSEVWPSQANPRQGYRQLSEVYTSTVERCIVASVTLPSDPTWYRANRTVLADCKTRLAAAIPAFLSTNNLSDTTPIAGAYYAANPGTNFSLALKNWTVTGLLWQARMPTNYFAYTPYRSLTGLGGDTNDVAVPYPHGFTNASTAAGGTNYPSGRTAWYSTDYGWQAWPSIMSNLLWVGATVTSTHTNRYYSQAFGSSWADAKANAEAAFGPVVPPSAPVLLTMGTWGQKLTTVDWQANMASSEFYADATASTAYYHQIEWYVWSKEQRYTNATEGGSGDYYLDASAYTNWGIGLVSNVLTYIGLTASTNSGSTRFIYGDTNMPPVWCAEPAGIGETYQTGLGYYKNNGNAATRYIVRYDVANGFVFY